MGLDMYLSRKTYVQNWPNDKPEDRIEIKLSGNTKGIDPEKITYVMEEVGYWRKANAIHGWIVNNCADGEDNCQEIYMSKEKLEELYKLCCFVLGNKGTDNEKVVALKNLPPTSGFFFGSTEIDEWYWKNIEDTINVLSKTLRNYPHDSLITYQASW